ncbi:MAG: SDR family NAD(P)-dependent oxidoreductase [Rhizobiales bacterium]|nr:SDR family NAD(P)-dependent oxidoreductase [Hyphomicrobiales bacterium]
MTKPPDRSVLVTGCSTGIGRAAAIGLRNRGWRVLATARSKADLASLAAEGLESIALELRDPASVAACAERALELTDGRLYGLFNNAAYGQPGAVEDLTPELLRDQFEVNFFSWHDLTRRLIPAMRANGTGRIVQCSSVLGFISPPYRGAYNASKHALEALSDAMRHELAGTGISVSLIEPGPIESRFLSTALAALRDNIAIASSPHAERYRARLAAMEAGGNQRFKLPPEAVLAKLVHALEAERPKLRYYVTFPTYFAAYAKCYMPRMIYDRILARS